VPASRGRTSDRADELEFLVAEFAERAAAEGVDRNPTAQARFLDVDNGHYNRVARGLAGIGDKFIARVLTAPWRADVRFEDFFRPRQVTR